MTAHRLRSARAVAWSPFLLPRSILRAWWNADDWTNAALVTNDGSGVISSWKDRINGLAVTGATTTRPTASASSFNSAYAGVTFDGSANTLASTTLTNLPTGSTPGTLWAVMQNALVSARVVVGYGGTAYRRILVGSGSALPTIGNGTQTAAGTTALSVGTPRIVVGEFGSSTIAVRVNGTQENSAAQTLATDTTRIRLGASTAAGASNHYSGVLRHVFITTALTADQYQRLEGWIAWDSGMVAVLPADHPYRWGRP